MNEFESFSFSRLYSGNNLEFFFIIGVNDSDNFTYDWDGTTKEVVGYITLYINQEKEQESFIYLINKSERKFEDIIRYAQKFISNMSPNLDISDLENCKICKTDIAVKSVAPPFSNFIKNIVRKDIPNSILEKL